MDVQLLIGNPSLSYEAFHLTYGFV